jgi:phosphatidylserine/phosphatidylglycerophosphate/cardiolipin synthase-like enzyme
MPRAKCANLLQDHDVSRWYESTARGSRISADVCLRRLGSFCEVNKTSLGQLASLPERELHNMLMDYVSCAEKKGYAGNYTNSTMKAVKSWLAHNNRELKVKIKIKGIEETPALKDERSPNN